MISVFTPTVLKFQTRNIVYRGKTHNDVITTHLGSTYQPTYYFSHCKTKKIRHLFPQIIFQTLQEILQNISIVGDPNYFSYKLSSDP